MVKSKLAVFSFVCSILAIIPLFGLDIFAAFFFKIPFLAMGLFLTPFFVLMGLVTSIISLFMIRKSQLDGKGLAIASLIISGILLILIFLQLGKIDIMPFA